MKASRILISIVFIILFYRPLLAIQLEFFQSHELTVRFDPPLRGIAEEMVDDYPRVKSNLEKVFGWELPFRPTVFLIQDKEHIRKLSGNPLVVALAMPEENIIVIDCSRLHIRPHRLDLILKHELVHLILHNYISRPHLPRWFDEGVAQWISEGVAELLVGPQRSLFEEAILTGKYISLNNLKHGFPRDNTGLILAYEESRSFVDFISNRFGPEKVFKILDLLRNGNDIHTAFTKSLDASVEEIEQQWIRQQHSQTNWLTYLAGHIYEFLFLLGAFLTVVGFIRFLIKKHKYADTDDDEADDENHDLL